MLITFTYISQSICPLISKASKDLTMTSSSSVPASMSLSIITKSFVHHSKVSQSLSKCFIQQVVYRIDTWKPLLAKMKVLSHTWDFCESKIVSRLQLCACKLNFLNGTKWLCSFLGPFCCSWLVYLVCNLVNRVLSLPRLKIKSQGALKNEGLTASHLLCKEGHHLGEVDGSGGLTNHVVGFTVWNRSANGSKGSFQVVCGDDSILVNVNDTESFFELLDLLLAEEGKDVWAGLLGLLGSLRLQRKFMRESLARFTILWSIMVNSKIVKWKNT